MMFPPIGPVEWLCQSSSAIADCLRCHSGPPAGNDVAEPKPVNMDAGLIALLSSRLSSCARAMPKSKGPDFTLQRQIYRKDGWG